jgi:hypothetical protein
MKAEGNDANSSKRLALEARHLATAGLTILSQMGGIEGGREAGLLRCILAEAETGLRKTDKAKEELGKVKDDVQMMFCAFRAKS